MVYSLYYLFSHDFIYIYDGNQKIHKLTGTILPATITSVFSDMMIVFTSDPIGTRKGFKITIQFLEPGKYTKGYPS